MFDPRFFGYSLYVCCVAATLQGCGGASNAVTPLANVNVGRERGTVYSIGQTFHYTGSAQTFIVPGGITHILVTAFGGDGAVVKGGGRKGLGGRVRAVLPVRPAEKLYVYVGGDGALDVGGFNGGGNAGDARNIGAGGGGSTDIRAGGTRISDRILVAGGGGGGGSGQCYSSSCTRAGDGGGGGRLTGGAGTGSNGGGGLGGTQRIGGAAGLGGIGGTRDGASGSSGIKLNGGIGGAGCPARCGSYTDASGGGGGGGYYGGGGGGAGGGDTNKDYPGGGGGGGSSYVEPSATFTRFWRGWRDTKNGLVIIAY